MYIMGVLTVLASPSFSILFLSQKYLKYKWFSLFYIELNIYRRSYYSQDYDNWNNMFLTWSQPDQGRKNYMIKKDEIIFKKREEKKCFLYFV